MKLIFKNLLCCYLILIAPKIFSRDIILIENMATSDEGILLKSILIKKFHLPEELITLKNIISDCEIRTDAIIHLCIKADGELHVKKINQYVVRRSLGGFLNQADEQGVVK